MADKFFKVLHRSKKSRARVGEIKTSHGVIKTPAFFVAATKGTVKALPPSFLKEIGSQVAFVNTYHLVTHPGADVIAQAGGIHKFANFDLPLMSDSGGFQVFSLKAASIRGEEQPLVVKISDDGVLFRSTYDGKLIEFTPEKSIEYQKKIGADIIIAFDECAPYPSSYKEAKRAMERTHQWLGRCVENHNDSATQFFQHLYGVIHGGTYEDLRKESAQWVATQDVEGIAIGGVAVGESKAEMRQEVEWVAPFLPKDKPVHLLGIGHFDDYLAGVTQGVDTFDCVEPTRLARMGRLYQAKSLKEWGEIDILKGIYKNNLEPIDKNCGCWVCQNFTKAYLHHLFKQREILGYTLATYHNLAVVNKFFGWLREAIAEDKI